jgi:hypothetical protein
VAAALADFKARISKPLLTCWMGDASVGEARTVLNTAMIPTFRTPEAAVGAFGNIASFYQNQQLLQQTPPPLSTLAKPDIEGARLLIESVLAERRNVLTEMESKALLSAFHIPVTKTILARNANEAMMIATQLGFPVALKIDSPDITHKSDVNGVALNVMNAVGVRDTYNDMMQAVKRNQPNARINGRDHPEHGTPQARPRDLHRPGHRRSVRPGDRLRRRRHHDRTHERPGHGAAPVEPVPGAQPDRPRARERDAGRVARRHGRGHGRAGARAAARLGNGLRIAPAAGDGHQPHHRGRVRCRGGGRAHRHRQRPASPWRAYPQLQPSGHPALPGAA